MASLSASRQLEAYVSYATLLATPMGKLFEDYLKRSYYQVSDAERIAQKVMQPFVNSLRLRSEQRVFAGFSGTMKDFMQVIRNHYVVGTQFGEETPQYYSVQLTTSQSESQQGSHLNLSPSKNHKKYPPTLDISPKNKEAKSNSPRQSVLAPSSKLSSCESTNISRKGFHPNWKTLSTIEYHLSTINDKYYYMVLEGLLTIQQQQVRQPEPINPIYISNYTVSKYMSPFLSYSPSKEETYAFKDFIKQDLERKEKHKAKLHKIDEENHKKAQEYRLKGEQQSAEERELVRKRLQEELKQQQYRRRADSYLFLAREKYYYEMKRKIKESPPAHVRLEEGYLNRKRAQYMEIEKEIKTTKKYSVSMADLEMHLKKYAECKAVQEDYRVQRIELMQQYLEARSKRSYSIRKNSTMTKASLDTSEMEDSQIIEAQERLNRMRKYQQELKDNHAPKVDPKKHEYLLELIGKLKAKYEHHPAQREDQSRLLGIQYLTKVKEAVKNAKPPHKPDTEAEFTQVATKPKVNYLYEMKKRRAESQTSRSRVTPLENLMRDRSLNLEEKVYRVSSFADQLLFSARRDEVKLKHGGFKTSDELLDCREKVDKQYLEAVRMKIQLMKK